MKSATELARNVGKVALYNYHKDISVKVLVLDSRERWGTTDYLIRPMQGTGKTWVAYSSLTFDK